MFGNSGGNRTICYTASSETHMNQDTVRIVAAVLAVVLVAVIVLRRKKKKGTTEDEF